METSQTIDNAGVTTTGAELRQHRVGRLIADLAQEFPEQGPPTVGGLVAEADMAIDLIVDAGNDLAMATFRETQLYDGRAEQKSAAIVRLMATNNAETSKLHSASSAEKVVELDADYAEYRNTERRAVVERIQAEAALSAAKLRARLAIVMAEASLP